MSYEIRQKLIQIARMDVGNVEKTRNQAPWIQKFWPSTDYPEGYKNREPYCAAGIAYCVDKWLESLDVCNEFGFTSTAEAEKWRCKSASAYGWLDWAKKAKGVKVLDKKCILHAGDLVVYNYSHIEIVTNDDNTETGPFVAIGFNTNASASREGEGCFEKPRSRSSVKAFIRLLP